MLYFFIAKTMGGMAIICSTSPGSAVTKLAPNITVKGTAGSPSNGNSAMVVRPRARRPPARVSTRLRKMFSLREFKNMPANKPKAANSMLICRAIGMGAMGGMPVSTELSRGVVAPAIAPGKGPRRKPARSTGMCMGKKTRPLHPNAWKAMGRTMPKVTNMAVLRSEFSVIFMSCFVPP